MKIGVKSVFNFAPMEYVKQLRLKKAQMLLISTDESVAAVGNAVGYGDPFHFSRLFKTFVGNSPKSYRNRSRHLID
ncbi:MAG: AraC family transcriptional regulator, partial [Patescibacteria group bacterium]|nr:AraC family transcriptional regulator [Patescibacteria group bacterium]